MPPNSRLQIQLRSIARRFGINRLLTRLFLSPDRYEQKFRDCLLGVVRPGDTVWDVGANVGIYSSLLSDAVGASGRVYSFEPSRESAAKLRALGKSNIEICQFALGAQQETLGLFTEGNSTSPVATLVSITTSTPDYMVDVFRGDQLVSSGKLPLPAVIKIDVEGFEEEVIDGMEHVLPQASLRAILMEIHFTLLEQRGRKFAADAISTKLARAGFSVSWCDPSHLVATRPQ